MAADEIAFEQGMIAIDDRRASFRVGVERDAGHPVVHARYGFAPDPPLAARHVREDGVIRDVGLIMANEVPIESLTISLHRHRILPLPVPPGDDIVAGSASPTATHSLGGQMNRHHVQPTGSPPAKGYSHAVTFEGRLVAVSGQVPLDAQGNLVGADDPEAQVRQVFENLKTALAAADAGLEHVVKLTIFLTDLADLETLRRVRNEYVTIENPPASSLVRVVGLVNPAFRVEIEALAAV